MDQKQSTSVEPSSETRPQIPPSSTPVPAPSASRSYKTRFVNFRPSILLEKFIPEREKRPIAGVILATILVLLLPAWVYGYVAFYVSETGANPLQAFAIAFLGHATLTVMLIYLITKCIDALNKNDGQPPPPHKKGD